jgi:ATP-dependent Lon protease
MSDPDEKGDLAKVGCSALILKMAKSDDNKQMLVQGLSRFHIKSFKKAKPYLRAKVVHFDDVQKEDDQTAALMANIVKQFARIVELSPGLPEEIRQMAGSIKEPGTLADMIASTINSTPEEKQEVLETQDTTTGSRPSPSWFTTSWRYWNWATRSSPRSRETWTSASGSTTFASSSKPLRKSWGNRRGHRGAR